MPPFAGRRIVVTRTPEQAGAWLQPLRALGAEAISLPTIALAPPADFAPLDHALKQLGRFHGFVFTSANGVGFFFDRAQAIGAAALRPSGAWLCALGPATAQALARHGWQAEIVPGVAVGEGVLAALAATGVAGQRILLPRGELGRELLPQALAERGAKVVCVTTHRTVLPQGSEAQARQLFPGVDAAIFTSPSTARNLATLLGPDYRERLQGVALVAIGPITRVALRELGLNVAVEAAAASADAVIAGLRDYWHA